MSQSSNTSLFRTPHANYLVPFILVSSLFLLWGFCNGMIDVMDKHFQEELGLSLSQSAWVQFAHYLGYFLMALPAGWIAARLGYKGGIIAGLLMVSIGGFWFIPASHIAAFWAFLLGVCVISAGLTFLETVANPYATVLGPREFAAARINLAQSCNGVGWILGPIAGSWFFYSTDASGRSTGAETLWIPYAVVAVVVIVLAVVFLFARIPDVRAHDDYAEPAGSATAVAGDPRPAPSTLAGILLWLNVAVLSASIGMIASAVVSIRSLDDDLGFRVFAAVTLAALIVGTVLLVVRRRRASGGSIWAHPHFSGATLAQFFYVAAQSGIFAYFINYMTAEPPTKVSNQAAATLASVGFACFLGGRVTGAALLKRLAAHRLLGLYGLLNSLLCIVVLLKLGWLSVVAVFLSYFFMSIMFPTIFALGIFGLGDGTKKASAYIVMAIMGGAIMPKFMGHVADAHGLSRSFIVPALCFLAVAVYGLAWTRLRGKSRSEGIQPVDATTP